MEAYVQKILFPKGASMFIEYNQTVQFLIDKSDAVSGLTDIGNRRERTIIIIIITTRRRRRRKKRRYRNKRIPLARYNNKIIHLFIFSPFLSRTRRQLVYIAQADRHTSSMFAACDLSHVYIYIYKRI